MLCPLRVSTDMGQKLNKPLDKPLNKLLDKPLDHPCPVTSRSDEPTVKSTDEPTEKPTDKDEKVKDTRTDQDNHKQTDKKSDSSQPFSHATECDDLLSLQIHPLHPSVQQALLVSGAVSVVEIRSDHRPLICRPSTLLSFEKEKLIQELDDLDRLLHVDVRHSSICAIPTVHMYDSLCDVQPVAGVPLTLSKLLARLMSIHGHCLLDHYGDMIRQHNQGMHDDGMCDLC